MWLLVDNINIFIRQNILQPSTYVYMNECKCVLLSVMCEYFINIFYSKFVSSV